MILPIVLLNSARQPSRPLSCCERGAVFSAATIRKGERPLCLERLPYTHGNPEIIVTSPSQISSR